MRKLTAKVFVGALAAVMVFGSAVVANPTTASAAKVTVKKVTVKAPSGKTAYVAKGKKISLTTTVTATPNKAANKKVTYKSANKKIAKVTAKGVVKGVKAGTTKITVVSKKNKKKKATIKVVVKKGAVTKIKLNATKATLEIGKKKTLKATVTAKNGSKKVVWSTSKKSVATVSSKGVVTAKKAGSATITVKAADGSGKKATCKVTVAAAKTNLTKAAVDNARTVTFALDKKTTLDKSKVTVMRKSIADGTYQDTLTVDDISTSDSMNYTVTLSYKSALSLYDYVQVSVPSLTGTKTAEAQYKEDVAAFTDDEISTWTVDQYNSESFYFGDGYGYNSFTISNLPAGLTSEKRGWSLDVKGTPTTAGTTEALLKGVDEYGNSLTKTIYFVVGSDDKIAGAGKPAYALEAAKDTEYNVDTPFVVMGGSGTYKAEVVSNIGAELTSSSTFNSGSNRRIRAKGVKAGDYTVTVKVTDVADANRTTEFAIPIHVTAAITLSGTLKDATGAGMAYRGVTLTFTNKDRSLRLDRSYSPDFYVDSDDYEKTNATNGETTFDQAGYDAAVKAHYAGSYEVRVPAGIYDISLAYQSGADFGTVINTYKQTYSASQTGLDFTLPVYKVTLTGNKDSQDTNVHPQYFSWALQNGPYINVLDNYYSAEEKKANPTIESDDYTAFTYLPAGTYVLQTSKIEEESDRKSDAKGTEWFDGGLVTTTYTTKQYRYTANVTIANAAVSVPIAKVDAGTATSKKDITEYLGVKNTTYTAYVDGSYELDETYKDSESDYNQRYWGYKFVPEEDADYTINNSSVFFYDETGKKVDADSTTGKYTLKKGTTYYVAAGYTGSYSSFRISKVETPVVENDTDESSESGTKDESGSTTEGGTTTES